MGAGQVSISVIIPVKNGADTLERCLKSIRQQTVADTLEIIVLDSGSTDRSRSIALAYDVNVVPVEPEDFNHGLTRNEGVKLAESEFLFFTVQDAFLSTDDFLEKMATHFSDEAVMGVVGHQAVPHEKDKNPMLWFKRFSEPKVEVRQVNDSQHFLKADQEYQQSLIAWDNVVAMYRKTALLDQPFTATGFAEDWIWSQSALLKGWKLIYDPSLVIYHYHHQSYRYAYQTAFTVNYHFYKFFKFKPVVPPLIKPIIQILYHLSKHPGLTVKEKVYWIAHNFMVKLGTYNSHVNFLSVLRKGGMDNIQKRYESVCKQIPQGRQKRKQ